MTAVAVIFAEAGVAVDGAVHDFVEMCFYGDFAQVVLIIQFTQTLFVLFILFIQITRFIHFIQCVQS